MLHKMSPASRRLRTLAFVCFAGAFACLCFVSGLIATPRERFLAGLSLLLIASGAWLLAWRAYRFRAGHPDSPVPPRAVVLAIVGACAIGLAFAGPCSILPAR